MTKKSEVTPNDIAAALDWLDCFVAGANCEELGNCRQINTIRAALAQSEATQQDSDWMKALNLTIDEIGYIADWYDSQAWGAGSHRYFEEEKRLESRRDEILASIAQQAAKEGE